MPADPSQTRALNTQGKATRKLILDTAGRLFAEQGFSGACLRQIARESGVALSSVMYHFKSKQKLFLETIRHFVIDAANLNAHFECFASVDYADPQALADAIRAAVRSFLGACHGRNRTEHMNELYARIIVEGDAAALGMLVQCFVGVQQLLPSIIRRIRPDFDDIAVGFWLQLFWSQLQYTVMGKKLILYDMKLAGDFTEEYLDAAAWHIAWYCCLPLGLPAPTRPGQ